MVKALIEKFRDRVLEAVDDIAVVAAAARHAVGVGAAVQRVVARATKERIVAAAAEQGVVSAPTLEVVGAGSRNLDPVREGGADDRLVGIDSTEMAIMFEVRGAGEGVAAERDIAGAKVDRQAGGKGGAAAGRQCIVAHTAIQFVAEEAWHDDLVIAITGADRVVAEAGIAEGQCVVAAMRLDQVGDGRLAGDGIVVRGADDILDPGHGEGLDFVSDQVCGAGLKVHMNPLAPAETGVESVRPAAACHITDEPVERCADGIVTGPTICKGTLRGDT